VRLFVSEYLCSGAWPEPHLSHSLAREGRAMLLAMLADLSTLPDVSLYTTWDARLGTFPFVQGATGSARASQSVAFRKDALAEPAAPDVSTCGAPFNVECTVIDTTGDEAAAFQRLARECDATYVIAPELDDLLTRRVQSVLDVGGLSLNASTAAIAACSDKWETYNRLIAPDIPTVPTACFNPAEAPPFNFPLVVKPRHGAGSQDTFLLHNAQELSHQLSSVSGQTNPKSKIQNPKSATPPVIVQPYIPGRSLSVAAIFRSDGTLHEVWPVGEQRLSADGRFTYLGGTLPVQQSFEPQTPGFHQSDFGSEISNLRSQISDLKTESRDAHAVSDFGSRITNFITSVSRAIPGLRGYIGFDLILPDGSPETPLIVDINPRLTTSYLGYRALSNVNLAERILWPDLKRPPIDWDDAQINFDAGGAITRSSASRG